MGSLLVSTHRGFVHWQGLLLVVSLLTFWSLPTSAQLSIVSTYGTEGEDVQLRIRNKPPDAIAYVWYKGEGVNNSNILAFFIMTPSFRISGPENNGEEMTTNDGSLLLEMVTMEDAGMYTVVAHLPDLKKEIGYGQLDVYERLEVPMLITSNNGVRENKDDVVLTCFTNGVKPRWLLNGMDLKFTSRMNLTADGRRITIKPVTREDAGDYKCKVSNQIMSVESNSIELYVYYD